MTLHLLLLFFVISFGISLSCFALALSSWLRDKELWQFKTMLFTGYLAVLLLLEGISYYSWVIEFSSPAFRLVLNLFRVTGYALLMYYLPATLNYISRKKWTPGKLALTLSLAGLYLAGGITGYSLGGLAAVTLPVSALLVIYLILTLMDAAREIPKIKEFKTRLLLSVLAGAVLVFLPLISITDMFSLGPEVRFFILFLFYFWLGLIGSFYFIQPVSLDKKTEPGAFRPEVLKMYHLTPREIEIISYLEKGESYKEIGSSLGISAHTVGTHITRIYRKTGVNSKIELLHLLKY